MPQFAVHQNKNPQTAKEVPFLLDVQNDLLRDLQTRVVVPLCLLSRLRDKPLRTLSPVFEIEGERYAMLTPQLAGIAKAELGPAVAHLETHRFEIVGALDFLITGL
jgi:toxin CcdB